MSKHLKHATSKWAQHLSEIDEAAANLARQRKAAEDHASLVDRSTPPTTPALATDHGGNTNETHA